MILAHAARLGHSPWEFHAHPDVALLVLGIAAVYAIAFRRFAPPDLAHHERRRLVLRFAGGLGLMWLVSEWPVHDLAEGWSYTTHMAQHLTLTLAVPPILLAAAPAWMLRPILQPVMPVFRMLVRPVPALLLFNATIALTHWPALTDLAVRNGPAHLAQHTALVATALLMWWPVVAPLPEWGQLPPIAKMVYLFVQSLVPTVPASWLAFADHPLYHSYEAFPKLFGMTAGEDQALAGALMKIVGGLALWSVIIVIFFKWAAQEHGGRKPAAQVDECREAEVVSTWSR